MTIDYTNNALLITLRHLKQKGFVVGLEMVWELFKAIMLAALQQSAKNYWWHFFNLIKQPKISDTSDRKQVKND